jgi:uncharacterized membrane protein YbhN (UPF0104 family)
MTTRHRPWWQSVLAAALLLLVMAYVYRHRETLHNLPPLDATSWLAILAATAAGTLVSVLAVQRMLAAMATPTSIGEMFLLHNAAHLLNLLPLKAGTLLRANYLRSHHDLSYPRFGVFALYLTLLTAFVTSLLGLGCLLVVYGLEQPVNRVFAGILAAASVATLAVLLLPLPVPHWEGRWGNVLRQLLDARRELMHRPAALLPPVACLLTTYLLGVVRLGLIYAGLGLDAHPGGLLLLGALGQISTLANLTPGGLGVRELLLGGGAAVLGVPVEAGLLAALIERAVGLAWAVVVGLPSAVWVWRRRPG